MHSFLHNLFLRIARHHNPRLAVFLSLLLALIGLSWAALSLVSSGSGITSNYFFVLLGFSTAGAILTPLVTELTRSGRPSTGLAWITIESIPLLLIIVLVSPVAGFFGAAISVLLSHCIFRIRRIALLHNVASMSFTYLLVGSCFHLIDSQSLTLLEKAGLIFIAGALIECVGWTIDLLIRGLYDGEAVILSDYRSIAHVSTILVAIATFFAGVFLIVGFTALTICLSFGLLLVVFGELLARFRLDIEGQRALSWGAAAAALKLVGDQDDRLRRHSINVARYMRDFAKELKMSRGVQELAFMYGLLHDIGLAGLKRHIRIAEEEYLRDDAPPEPVAGEKTFQWQPPEQIEDDDTTGQVINKGRETCEALAGGPTESMQEPAWWRSKDARKVLTDEDIDQLDCHELIGGMLLQSANAYGCLPELIANHHQPPTQNPKSTKEKLQHMLAICDRYESLSAVDGSFPAQKPVNAITLLEADAGERFDQQLFSVFTNMMQRQSTAYQNGTDIDYASQGHIEDFLDPLLPGAFNLAGWLKFGMTTPNTINAIATHKKRKA